MVTSLDALAEFTRIVKVDEFEIQSIDGKQLFSV